MILYRLCVCVFVHYYDCSVPFSDYLVVFLHFKCSFSVVESTYVKQGTLKYFSAVQRTNKT